MNESRNFDSNQILSEGELVEQPTKFTDFYRDLAPSSDVDSENIYCDSINWAIRSENVTNIALMGAYGSGKSSIIETFIKRNSNKYNFLKLSLATFTNKSDVAHKEQPIPQTSRRKNTQKLKKESEEQIELSLLQQIFYQVDPNKIPNSRFKRIRNIDPLYILSCASILFLLLFSFLVMIKPKFIADSFIEIVANYIASNIFLTVLFFLLFSLFIIVAIYFTIETLQNKRLVKLNLKNAEINLSDDNEPSILNKYMDEILYFFEVTDYNVVVIEDLDRFDNINLFTKLREINILINETEANKGENKKIVFLYAVKEDLFEDIDRIKFFDFIIPIVPVINTFNAEEKLLSRLSEIMEDSNNKIKIDTSFICDIAMFIPDMRLLTNIINEFVLYKELLKDSLPKADINKRTGYEKLLAIIVYKNLYPDDFVKINTNHGKLYTIISSKGELILKAQFEPKEELKKKEEEKDNLDETLSEEEPDTTTYKELSKKLKQKEQEILKLSERINIISGFSLSQLLNYDKIQYDYNVLENTQSKKLVIYLLEEGYLDEDYFYYISYFYGKSLTRTDRDFLFSVKRGVQEERGYKLHKIDVLLSRIELFRFGTKSVLNIDLLDFMLHNDVAYNDKLEKLFAQLIAINKSSKQLLFIDDYTDRGIEQYKFINKLLNKWEGFWVHMTKTYSEDKINKLLTHLLAEAFWLTLYRMETESKKKSSLLLSSYINRNPKLILSQTDAFLGKMKDVLRHLKLKLEDITIEKSWNELHDYILEKEHYVINKQNLEFILQYQSKESNINTDYTAILNSGCEHLIKYINDNIEVYINDMYLELQTKNETEENMISLLNNTNISIGLRKSIIEGTNVIITDVSRIDSAELLHSIFQKYLYSITWSNLFNLFERKDGYQANEDQLIDTLNDEEIIYELPKEIESILHIDDFQDYITKNSKVEDNSFFYLINHFPSKKYDDLEHTSTSLERMYWLILNGSLNLTIDNFKMLEENYSFEILLLEQYSDKIISVKEDFQKEDSSFDFDSYQYSKIIDSNSFSNESKKSIMGNDISDKKLTDSKDLCDSIIKYANRGGATSLTYPKIKIILGKKGIILDEKVKFITHYSFKDIPVDSIIEWMTLLGTPYSKIIEYGKKPSIDYTESAYKLSCLLKSKGLLYNNKIETRITGRKVIVFHSKFPQ